MYLHSQPFGCAEQWPFANTPGRKRFRKAGPVSHIHENTHDYRPYYAHRSYLWFQLLLALPIPEAFSLLCLPGGTPADLLKKIWYNFRRVFLSKCRPCGNHPGQKLFLEAIELLKPGFWLNAVSQLTSCGWEHRLSNWSAWGNLSWSTEPPECPRKAFSSLVVYCTCLTYTQTPIFPKILGTTWSLGFLLLCKTHFEKGQWACKFLGQGNKIRKGRIFSITFPNGTKLKDSC